VPCPYSAIVGFRLERRLSGCGHEIDQNHKGASRHRVGGGAIEDAAYSDGPRSFASEKGAPSPKNSCVMNKIAVPKHLF